MIPLSLIRNLKVPAKHELILGFVILILIILGVTFDWTEQLVNFLYTYKDLPIDELIITLIILGFIVMVYLMRRRKESSLLIETNRHSQLNVKEHEEGTTKKHEEGTTKKRRGL